MNTQRPAPTSTEIRPTTKQVDLHPLVAAIPSVDVLGVAVNRLTYRQLLDQMDRWIADANWARSASGSARMGCHQVCTVNPEFVVDAQRHAEFARVLQCADLRVADGAGIVWAARLQGVRLPERITGSDGIYRICERAAQAGWRVFFLGAAPGVAQRTADALQRLYPGLTVAGTYAGSPQTRDWPLIAQRLADVRPDVLLVAFGHPRQDIWIHRHRHELPTAVAIGVGGAFDFVAGVTQRAPLWMRCAGLEWLHRLLRQPWRWRRMAKLPVFAWLVFREERLGNPHTQ